MNKLMQKCHSIIVTGEDSIIDNFSQTIKERGGRVAEIESIKEQVLPFDINLPDDFSKVSSDDEIDIERKLDKGNFLLTNIKSDTSGINDGINNLNIKFDSYSTRLERILEKLVERLLNNYQSQ